MGRGARMMDYDLIVVGGGAAGLGAVRAALWAGADVALVSDSAPGGDCTFTGCVPSKTLLAAARDGLDFAAAMARVRATVEHIAATESADVLRSEGATVIEGRARLVTHDTVAVGERRITASRIVLATGSRPSMPDIRGLAEARPLTNETVFDLTEAPKSLGIIGGGATGCELAQAFAALGVEVTLFEVGPQLLRCEEPEAGALVRAALQDHGISVRRNVRVARIESAFAEDRSERPTSAPIPGSAEGVDATGEHPAGGPYSVYCRFIRSGGMGDPIVVDQLLMAAGRTPAIDGLGLEEMKMKRSWSGYVITDDRLVTSVKGVYAAGDIACRPSLIPRRKQPQLFESGSRYATNGRRLLFRGRGRARVAQVRGGLAGPGAQQPEEVGLFRVVAAARSGLAYLRVWWWKRRERWNVGGDLVIGRAMLSHAADEMGRIAAGNAMGKGQRGKFRGAMVPRVVFTDPEVASVGVIPWHAPPGSRVAYLPLSEVDRAITDGRTDGFIAIVAGPRRLLRNVGGGRILGATIVAPRAGEMISEIVLAMRTGAFTGRLAQTSHAYPTWSSGVQKAAAQFFGEFEGRRARRVG